MEDAVILANAIYEIRAVNSENITTAFQDYYAERYPYAVEQLKFSKLFTMLMAGQVRKLFSYELGPLGTCRLSNSHAAHSSNIHAFFIFIHLTCAMCTT